MTGAIHMQLTSMESPLLPLGPCGTRKERMRNQAGGQDHQQEGPPPSRNTTEEAKVDLGWPWSFSGFTYKFDFTAQGTKERQLWGKKCFPCKINSSPLWKPGSSWEIKGITHLGLGLNTEGTVRSHLANSQLQVWSTPVSFHPKGASRTDPQPPPASHPNMWPPWWSSSCLVGQSGVFPQD